MPKVQPWQIEPESWFPRENPGGGSRGSGVDDRARGNCDRSPHHRKHRIGSAVHTRCAISTTLSDQAIQPDPGPEGRLRDESGAADVRVIGYEQPDDGYVLPLDTGHDSLFVMISRGRSWDQAPVEVDVHSHSDVDEFIVIDGGQGFLLNGPELGTVTRTQFTGPCVIVMPAGAFHRIVRTDDDEVDSILVYTDRRAVVPRYERIMERSTVVPVDVETHEGDAT